MLGGKTLSVHFFVYGLMQSARRVITETANIVRKLFCCIAVNVVACQATIPPQILITLGRPSQTEGQISSCHDGMAIAQILKDNRIATKLAFFHSVRTQHLLSIRARSFFGPFAARTFPRRNG